MCCRRTDSHRESEKERASEHTISVGESLVKGWRKCVTSAVFLRVKAQRHMVVISSSIVRGSNTHSRLDRAGMGLNQLSESAQWQGADAVLKKLLGVPSGLLYQPPEARQVN
jgi:hypothetical protein